MIKYKRWYRQARRLDSSPFSIRRSPCVIACEGWFLLWIIPLYVRELSWNWK